jgi:hypothetical protein
MFDKVSYRRGVLEGLLLYTLGRLGDLITPTSLHPDWLVVAGPIVFLFLQFLLAPFWATRRIKQTSKRERLSRRFWLLGPRLAVLCVAIDLLVSLFAGQALYTFDGIQHGPVLLRLFATGTSNLPWQDFALYEARNAVFLIVFYTVIVIASRLAQGGFLRFTMPAGGNRVTL